MQMTNILTKTMTIATQRGIHGEVDQPEHIHWSFGSQKNGGYNQTRWRGHPLSPPLVSMSILNLGLNENIEKY